MARLRSLGRLTATAAVLAVMLTLPGVAAGATLQAPATSLIYTAVAGETNSLTISRSGANFVFTDAAAVTITPAAPCVSVVANVATCPAAPIRTISASLNDLNDNAAVADSVSGIDSVAIFGAAGNDTLVGPRNVDSQINGDIGNDTLAGGDREDFLISGPGDDVATGALGNDRFSGDAGIDALDAGPGNDLFQSSTTEDGADTMIGGPDLDRLDIRDRPAALSISLDGVANDGEACPGAGCEGDNVGADIETLELGSGADVVTGSAAANSISGGGGGDSISGGGGGDFLSGGLGADNLAGGDGNDNLTGGTGSDITDGGGGDDFLSADYDGDGADVYGGGAGFDELGGGGEEGGLSNLPLAIDLDGVSDDGLVNGEFGAVKDNALADLEAFGGGGGDDTLIGNEAANEIEGGGGNDTIGGGGGDDGLVGGGGGDAIDGGAGVDSIEGGGGVDSLRSRDGGADQIDCGSSADSGVADAADQIEASCEALSSGLVIGAVKKGKKWLKLNLSCPAAEAIACAAEVKLRKGKKVVGSGKATIPAGASKLVKLKLKGKVKGTLEASADFVDAAGVSVTTTASVKVGK